MHLVLLVVVLVVAMDIQSIVCGLNHQYKLSTHSRRQHSANCPRIRLCIHVRFLIWELLLYPVCGPFRILSLIPTPFERDQVLFLLTCRDGIRCRCRREQQTEKT